MNPINPSQARRTFLTALLAVSLGSAVSAQEKHMRTTTVKSVRAVMDSGQSQMVAWALQRRQYRGSNPPEWNYVASWIPDGPPGPMAAYDAVYRKVAGMTHAEYLNKTYVIAVDGGAAEEIGVPSGLDNQVSRRNQ